VTGWDTILMVDWSGGNDRGPRPKADAIWIGAETPDGPENPVYCRNRQLAEAWLTDRFEAERAAGRRVLAGFDFPFGYPAGFSEAITGTEDALALWDWLEARIEDAPNANNRFEIAGQINSSLPGVGPFWGNGLKRDVDHLPRKGRVRTPNPFPERRVCEQRAKGAFTCWQLSGAGAVGSQVLMGLPVLARLRRRFAGQVAIWPFEPLDRPIAMVEIWPSLIAPAVAAASPLHPVKDAVQVMVMARALARLGPALAPLLEVPDTGAEGWILGLGHEAALTQVATWP